MESINIFSEVCLLTTDIPKLMMDNVVSIFVEKDASSFLYSTAAIMFIPLLDIAFCNFAEYLL